MKHAVTSLNHRLGPVLAVLLLAGVDEACCEEPGVPDHGSAALVVVLDNNYPPYIFLDEHGAMRGILPDQWALWSKKTGRRVELRPMEWAAAQRAMREGQADVIDTIFHTAERDRYLAFTRPYTRIAVPVYAHRSLGGIGDAHGLKGFLIGVKAGDAVIEHLQREGIDTLREFSGYEEIIVAAKRGEIKVFSVDEPAAEYYLYKHGIARDFNQLFVLYAGEFHRAVARQRKELLREIQDGFDRISSREKRAIRRKWMGATFLLKGFLLQWAPWIAGVCAAMLLLAAGNVFLGQRVRAKTAELRRALSDVQQSLAARMRAEEEKTAMQRQLANVQKLESLGRLAGTVAHDFNNMLQAILGYSELALRQLPADHPLHDIIAEIRKSALRSSTLTGQLQAFARRQPVSPRPVDINAAIGGMSSLLRRLLGSGITLEWSPEPELGAVMLDPGQIDQIVANLCINARDALAGSGTIRIEARNVRLTDEDAARMTDRVSGDCVQITIRDNGTGIPPEIRDRIFDPFFTTKPPDKGTGLGLAIVYAIVRQNGGGINVESEPGQGAAFHIFLPRCGDTPCAEPPPDALEPQGTRKTILLVDDEECVLLTTRHMLEGLGYRVHPAGRPGEALQILDRHAADIDLLLTDVVMPDMSGTEMARQMQLRQPGLRCLFMTGQSYDLSDEQASVLASGAWLSKPFSSQTLARHVREALTKA